MTQITRKALLIFLGCCATVNWWALSRMTVDDAFITWRYGKNLVNSGIWDYNPSHIDPTQAYTNPSFALLSIIPNLLSMDIVLFFKIFSTLAFGAFIIWYYKKTQGSSLLMLMLFLSLPATTAHAYAGLETFSFVALLTILFFSLNERNLKSSIVTTSLLFLTRPEAWLFVALTPAYYLLQTPESNRAHQITPLLITSNLDWRKGILCFLALGMPLAAYFIFHYYHFGNPLPNTFYVKKSDHLNITNFLSSLLLISPIFALVPQKKYKLLLVLATFLGTVSYRYGTAHMVMNYFGRFNYHLFAPVYLFMAYSSISLNGETTLKILRSSGTFKLSIPDRNILKGYLAALMIAFSQMDREGSDYYFMTSQYYRAIPSQAAIGKLLNNIKPKYNLHGFAMGDAGMAAYYSNLNALDHLLLGSKLATTHGITDELLDRYQIDVIAFHASPTAIRTMEFNQQHLSEWSKRNHFHDNCFVLVDGNYGFEVFSREPIPEFNEICRKSIEANSESSKKIAYQVLLQPPWSIWRE